MSAIALGSLAASPAFATGTASGTVITNNVTADREASAAAAGALLLADRTRENLVAGLFPPRPR